MSRRWDSGQSNDRRGGCLGCVTVLALLVGVLMGALYLLAPTTIGLTVKAYTHHAISTINDALTDKPKDKESAEADAPVDWYARAHLSEERQQVYDQLLEGVTNLSKTIAVIHADSQDVSEAYNAMMNDHPELFWLDGSFSYTYASLLDSVTVEPGFIVEPEDVPSRREAIEHEADAVLAAAGTDASEYDIAKLAYEHIASTTDYDISAENNQGIMSVFLGHRSVCAGYARAYQYLLQRAGLFCAYVEGSIGSRSEEHAWNLVRIDGAYAFVDPTWADPTYLGESPDAAVDGVIYDYLCVTSDEIVRDDHVFSNPDMWPVCNSPELDYYHRSGLFFENYDSQALADTFWREVEAQGSKVAFKFGSDEAYNQAVVELDGGQFLREQLLEYASSRGQDSVRYSYSVSDSLRIVKLYW